MIFAAKDRREVAVELDHYGLLRTGLTTWAILRRENRMNVKPQLDHFYGRKVIAVIEDEAFAKDAAWCIQLEGGAVIYNNNDAVSAPDDKIVGTVFMSTSMSGGDTTLRFGDGVNPALVTVTLTPNQYCVSTLDYDGGRPVDPQVAVELDTPPHPDDRIAPAPPVGEAGE